MHFATKAIWCACVATINAQSNASQPVTKSGFEYVDPLIGTTNGGHVFPGATLPFGRPFFGLFCKWARI